MADKPAALLRRAAALIKQRAEAATEGPWWSDESDQCWRLHGVAFKIPPQLFPDGVVCIPEQVMNKQILKAAKHGTPYAEYWPDAADDAHITSWHPGTALAVAVILEHRACEYDGLEEDGYGVTGARFVAGEYGGEPDPFIALARLYLGETPGPEPASPVAADPVPPEMPGQLPLPGTEPGP